MKLFDLHCDTAGEMLTQGQPLSCNTLAVSLASASVFERYTQVMAHWTDCRLTDEEGWSRFWQILQNLQNDPAVRLGKVTFDPDDTSRPRLILAVEDARILAGELTRVDALADAGVHILTPLWAGETCIGGSHDTNVGLTDFGKAAVKRAIHCGMIPDISHASRASADDIFEIAAQTGSPVIASHSNAYDVCPVSRNLRREQIGQILHADGLIGINLYTRFLNADAGATAADALPHIEYLCSLGAEGQLALGCDMDGCELPPDLSEVGALPRLAERLLAHNYPQSLVDALFWDNANRFAEKYLR